VANQQLIAFGRERRRDPGRGARDRQGDRRGLEGYVDLAFDDFVEAGCERAVGVRARRVARARGSENLTQPSWVAQAKALRETFASWCPM
jgi:hypothetical protein